jgi:hypothetical protein
MPAIKKELLLLVEVRSKQRLIRGAKLVVVELL